MSEMVRIALDAMGGDNAPGEIVKGAVQAANEDGRIKLFFVGRQEAIAAELEKYTGGDRKCHRGYRDGGTACYGDP